jgi:hypothetical protein
VTRVAVIDSDRLTREDLGSLLQERHAHCVSLFLRMAQVGQQTPADGIRLKNLVKQAVDGLIERGVRRPDAEAILAPASQLIDEPLRWQTDGEGLALFLSEEGAHRFKLPYAFEDLVIVNDRFHIEQLLPVINHEKSFYVMALSLKHSSFYEGHGRRITEIAIPNMPKDITEVLQFNDYDVNPSGYSNSTKVPGRARQSQASYTTAAPTKDIRYREMQGYFRAVDAALFEVLKLERAPLVAVCLPEEWPLYREINRYQHLTERAVLRDPALMSEDEIFQRAWEIVLPIFEKEQADALARFNEYAATDRASGDLAKIVPAAMFGRVESLLVRAGTHLWGAFDPATGDVLVQHDERMPGDDDLIDVATSYALATRGEVFQLPPELMPQKTAAAAVFRY